MARSVDSPQDVSKVHRAAGEIRFRLQLGVDRDQVVFALDLDAVAGIEEQCDAVAAQVFAELADSMKGVALSSSGSDSNSAAPISVVRTANQQLSVGVPRRGVAALPEVLADPGHLDARSRMQLGAAYAGAAIENSMLGAAHAAANPLTAQFGVVHGHAVGLMLQTVVRFNAADPAARETYARLAVAARIVAPAFRAVTWMPSKRCPAPDDASTATSSASLR